MKIALVLLGILAAVILLLWLGLQIKPAPFRPYPRSSQAIETVPLPKGLPAPVERFYRQLYREGVPRIESAVISGRARLRINGITFPSRFRFTHDAGQGYRHYIEATLWGLPILKVNEYYLEGVGRMELPFGMVEEGPQVEQGANLGLWAESLWLASLLVIDTRVEWKAVDDATAILVVPFGDDEQQFVARFDTDSGMLTFMEAMRYKGAETQSKTLWIDQVLEWGEIDGYPTLARASATWFDEGSPWAVFSTDEVVYNVEVDDYIRAKGP